MVILARLILHVRNIGRLGEGNFYVDQAQGYANASEGIDVPRQLFLGEIVVLHLDSHSHGSSM